MILNLGYSDLNKQQKASRSARKLVSHMREQKIPLESVNILEVIRELELTGSPATIKRKAIYYWGLRE